MDNDDLLTEAGVAYLTEADLEMLEFVMNAKVQDFDPSVLFLDDED